MLWNSSENVAHDYGCPHHHHHGYARFYPPPQGRTAPFVLGDYALLAEGLLPRRVVARPDERAYVAEACHFESALSRLARPFRLRGVEVSPGLQLAPRF